MHLSEYVPSASAAVEVETASVGAGEPDTDDTHAGYADADARAGSLPARLRRRCDRRGERWPAARPPHRPARPTGTRPAGRGPGDPAVPPERCRTLPADSRSRCGHGAAAPPARGTRPCGVRVRAPAEAVRDAAAPATPPRRLAADLGRARDTGADAAPGLVADGWPAGRRGSYPLVADRVVTRPIFARSAADRSGGPRHDPGSRDPAASPRAVRRKATRRALAAAPEEAPRR